ncbi:MAG: glycosyltransferase family 2 protein, partial [Proteobacteria bacterium]|nr:glycosyltransferase family 2 protein [Pseudomonadota bacterium]NDD05266.1 glycosyltransferase family 2 protein [Pseudomonadota bacterium]
MLLSAVVITRNEEKRIEQCLSSLSFCDEVIVVDSGSVDKTCEIARKLSAQVVIREWEGYAAQKNFANSLAKGKWILSIDADEEVSSNLKQEILSVITNTQNTAFLVPRRTIHSGQWIRHGGWYPNRLIRLFQKDKAQWVDEEIHEFIKVEGP